MSNFKRKRTKHDPSHIPSLSHDRETVKDYIREDCLCAWLECGCATTDSTQVTEMSSITELTFARIGDTKVDANLPGRVEHRGASLTANND